MLVRGLGKDLVAFLEETVPGLADHASTDPLFIAELPFPRPACISAADPPWPPNF